ncbi:MAG TPA: DUF2786 domain-containing protein [Kofleriaceae bacterium]|nr:DUF2786 domain-containing protein [Kofleriaceae bacterium]
MVRVVEGKIVDRIRKLLALSQSSNQHEAAAAAARAAELMTAHHLHAAMLADDETPAPIDAHEIETTGQAVSWRGSLASGIAYSFGCRMFWKPGYRDGKRFVRSMVVGRPADVDGVRYMYLYLRNEVDRLAREAWDALPGFDRQSSSARSWKNAFRLGAAVTIARRLREARDQALQAARTAGDDRTSRALVRVERDTDAVEQFMAQLGTRKKAPPTVSAPSGLGAGMAAARDLDIGSDHRRLGRPVARLAGRSR